jgi:ribonucleotide monophosphatase NagD (HAD superfamily)
LFGATISNGTLTAFSVQVASDAILAGGIIGGPHDYELKQKVELVFCNPDLVWKSEFPRPRFGQGSFKAAFQAVFKVRSSPG